MAEYCSINDAFPASLASPSGRGTSATASQERRRAKKSKGDADRPSLRADVPDYMRGSGASIETASPYNPATGLYSHQCAEPFVPNDESAMPVTAPKSAYGGRKPGKSMATSTILPEVTGAAKPPKKTPAYFGADFDEDEMVDGFLQQQAEPNEIEEAYANFTPSMADENEFMMSADFAKIGKAVGADRAANSALPIPSIIDEWKRLTPSGARSASFEALPSPGGEFVLGQPSMDHSMRKKLDQILARLDDLETASSSGENNQMEIFMFILSGMFVMFALDIFARRR